MNFPLNPLAWSMNLPQSHEILLSKYNNVKLNSKDTRRNIKVKTYGPNKTWFLSSANQVEWTYCHCIWWSRSGIPRSPCTRWSPWLPRRCSTAIRELKSKLKSKSLSFQGVQDFLCSNSYITLRLAFFFNHFGSIVFGFPVSSRAITNMLSGYKIFHQPM